MTPKHKEIQERYGGKPLDQILRDEFAALGSQKAVASKLGVSQGTISLWLKDCGLKVITTLEETERYRLSKQGRKAVKAAKSSKAQVG